MALFCFRLRNSYLKGTKMKAKSYWILSLALIMVWLVLANCSCGQKNERCLKNNSFAEAEPQYYSRENATPNSYILYRGKTRTRKWFDEMYEKFSSKYVFIDGKYIHKTSLVKGERETNKFWSIGSVVRFPYHSHVEKVLKNGEVIISNDDCYGVKKVFHVHGLEHSYVVGEVFPTDGILFKCTGVFPYKYTTPGWVPGHHGYVGNLYAISVVVYKPKPLTKAQFADAIKSGLELTEYTEIRGKTIKKQMD